MTNLSVSNPLFYFGLYLLECSLVYVSYGYVHDVLDSRFESFRSISPTHKKWYVVSNVVKGASLALLVPLYYKILQLDVIGGIWDADYVAHLGCIYAALDCIGVVRVPRLAKNTMYHHVAVNLMFFYVLTNGVSGETFSRLIALYAVFSAMAFPVNLYLGMRIVCKDERLLKWASTICFVNYVSCCAANWSYQLYHLIWLPHFYTTYGVLPVISFCGMITVIMWDDIILIKYLKRVSFFRDVLDGQKWLAAYIKSA